MSVITPNMSLIQSTVGIDTGLSWEQNLNQDISIIDGHDHTPGSGVQITPSAININSDFAFNNHNAINLRSARFNSQSSPLSGVSPDLDCIYVSGGDLYYNDGVGNIVRVTQSGAIAGTPGSITGLVAPASVTYIPVGATFVFQSNINTPANIDVGSVTLRKISASSNGITLSVPSGLASDYTLTLPIGLPGSNAVPLVSSAGAVSWQITYDAIVGSSAQVTAGTATHSTLTAAIAAVSANGMIKVLQGAWTENIFVNKTLNIIGSGYNTVITGTMSITGSNYCVIQGVRWSGNFSIDSTSNGNQVTGCFIGASATAFDSGAGNYIELIQG